MFLLNNVKVWLAAQITIGDTQYPPCWFLDPAERTKVGIVEVADPVLPDANLYTWVENIDGSYTTTPIALDVVKAARKSLIETAYQTAITAPIAYMATTFQADNASQDILVKVLLGMQVAGATPAGFAWMDANNVAVPMTLAELQSLYAAILARGQIEFTKKIIAKQAVDAATTLAAVQAVTL